MKKRTATLSALIILAAGNTMAQGNVTNDQKKIDSVSLRNAISQPLVSHIYTADPAAHVFKGRIYIYPSHDIQSSVLSDGTGSQFDMKDYHVLSMDSIGGKVIDHGVGLSVDDIPWAGKQLWAPDAAYRDGKYYLYFPLKDKKGIFRIGVAVADLPEGPFKADRKPIKGSFSIDPAVFADTDGTSYMYFGGIHGGQLQKWTTGKFDSSGPRTDTDGNGHFALSPKVVKLKSSMHAFAEKPRNVIILDNKGDTLLREDHQRRFFEGAWVHKYMGKYYLSYSTGDTHQICYATASTPYGPFIYQGVILTPVIGWTTHHSIIEVKGKWFLFYHDTQLSNGKTHLRNIKVTPLTYDANGRIKTIDPYRLEK